MLRIMLFIATNLAVLAVLSLVITLLGLNQPGMQTTTVLVFAAAVGMGGALISLLMSKPIAIRTTGARVIDRPRHQTELWLVNTVRRQADGAGIGMPEVAIFDSPTPNAFATGARKDNALVAVSTGLLNSMAEDEAEAVLGHEVSHVANGDMVTLALLQGVLNTFVLVIAHVVSALVDRRGRAGNASRHGSSGGIGYRASYLLTQLVFGFLATLIVRWFSRFREFRADAGGASLAGRNSMIAALERLQAISLPQQLPRELQAFGITPAAKGIRGFQRLLSTHPPLSQRIVALKSAEPAGARSPA